MLLQRFYAVTIPPVMETSLVVFVFTTIFLGEIQQFYDTLWWWDTVLHALAGFGLTLIGHILLGVIHREAGSRPLPMVLTLFAFTFALGVSALWEVYEFAVDSLSTMTNMQPSGEDTMWDIISATVAALPASYIGWKWWHRARNTAAETDAVSQVIDDGVDGFSGGTMK